MIASPVTVATDQGVGTASVAGIIRALDARLAEILNRRLKPRFDADVYRALYDDILGYVSRPGKRVRPLLYLAGREIFGGNDHPVESGDMDVAAGIELMHAFVLVHDDIIDRSDMRRGLPSLHKAVEKRLSALSDRERESQNIAIVLGDILFGIAQASILSSGIAHRCTVADRFVDYVIDTGLGETADIIHGTRDLSKVSIEDIEHMYLLKTTRYTIECPLVLAAIASDSEDALLRGLARMAEPAGLAFQIENDLKAFERFERSDAEVPDDLIDGKKTAVVRTAFDLLQNGDRSLLQICIDSTRQSDATITKMKELIYKSGSLEICRRRVEQLFGQSARLADHLPCTPDRRDRLVGLIQQVRGLSNSGN